MSCPYNMLLGRAGDHVTGSIGRDFLLIPALDACGPRLVGSLTACPNNRQAGRRDHGGRHRRRTAAGGVRLQAGASTRPAPLDQLGDRLRLHLTDRRPLHRRRARRRDGRAGVGVERADRDRRSVAGRARLRAARGPLAHRRRHLPVVAPADRPALRLVGRVDLHLGADPHAVDRRLRRRRVPRPARRHRRAHDGPVDPARAADDAHHHDRERHRAPAPALHGQHRDRVRGDRERRDRHRADPLLPPATGERADRHRRRRGRRQLSPGLRRRGRDRGLGPARLRRLRQRGGGDARRCTAGAQGDRDVARRVWRQVAEWNRSPVYATLLVAVLASLAFA